MLALTRKIGERIVMGDNIIITIVDIRGENIRLAIDAPKEVKIYRGEIYDEIVAENKQSAVSIGVKAMDVLGKIQKK